MKIICLVVLLTASRAAVIESEKRPEIVLSPIPIPITIQTDIRARNKIEAVDRTRTQTAGTESPSQSHPYMSNGKTQSDSSEVATKSADSCSHSRPKRFLNPFQILGSVHDEGLDRPRIPYVRANFLSFSDEDEDESSYY
jgi:hypothetical protein